LLALFPKFSSAQFEDTASVLEWLETECATDTTELSEYCDLIEYAVLCLEGDSVYCDSLDWALEGLDISDASDSTDTSGDDGSDVGDGLEDDGDDDESDDDDDDENEGEDDESDDDDDDESDDDNMNNWTVQDWADYFIADCAEDSTGMDEACAYVVLSESCLAGDSLACAELELGIAMYEDGDDEDDYDDGYDDEGDDDDDGLTAAEEGEWGTDPNNNDSDGDGLTDGDEVNLFNLSPTNPDTDGNGVSDPVDLVFLLLEQNANGGGIPEVDPCPSDINKDGTVTVTDMLIFLSDFGTICF
jgi:hypothetical protein